MTRIEWTEPAVSDLENIQDYIARDSAEYADAIVERLILSVDRLASFPESGRLVPEASDPKTCELLVQSYRVIYSAKEMWCCAQQSSNIRSWSGCGVPRLHARSVGSFLSLAEGGRDANKACAEIHGPIRSK